MSATSRTDGSAVTQEANALADAAVKQARAVSATGEELLEASAKYSLHSSEVIGGAVAGE